MLTARGSFRAMDHISSGFYLIILFMRYPARSELDFHTKTCAGAVTKSIKRAISFVIYLLVFFLIKKRK